MNWDQLKSKLKHEVSEHPSSVDIDEIWTAIEPEVDKINAEKHKRKGGLIWLLFLGAIISVVVVYTLLNSKDAPATPNKIEQTKGEQVVMNSEESAALSETKHKEEVKSNPEIQKTNKLSKQPVEKLGKPSGASLSKSNKSSDQVPKTQSSKTVSPKVKRKEGITNTANDSKPPVLINSESGQKSTEDERVISNSENQIADQQSNKVVETIEEKSSTNRLQAILLESLMTDIQSNQNLLDEDWGQLKVAESPILELPVIP